MDKGEEWGADLGRPGWPDGQLGRGPAGGGGFSSFCFFVSLLYFLSFIYFVVSFIFSFIKLPLVPNLYLPINYYEINS